MAAGAHRARAPCEEVAKVYTRRFAHHLVHGNRLDTRECGEPVRAAQAGRSVERENDDGRRMPAGRERVERSIEARHVELRTLGPVREDGAHGHARNVRVVCTGRERLRGRGAELGGGRLEHLVVHHRHAVVEPVLAHLWPKDRVAAHAWRVAGGLRRAARTHQHANAVVERPRPARRLPDQVEAAFEARDPLRAAVDQWLNGRAPELRAEHREPCAQQAVPLDERALVVDRRVQRRAGDG
eukprot:CAMPEP_0119429034 /NCGR_PEP_ID=MMETSP1335-20130426/41502_1 /TAXON_ID=259385 /ORGANISM="Chrysoculter rhomboideus, Strain RCC1486" /LENGTH=240 /DNA_ID=CAMNT_0007454739 /DNA_START=296 /DNA_END=1022 /DNA_ORIENTATION=+